MKIRLTIEQHDELRRRALAAQESAEKAFLQARERYNKILKVPSEIDLKELAELAEGLPEDTPTGVFTYGYSALSRSGRTEGHTIEVTGSRAQNRANAKCSCPGFKNHGYCWASTEARLLFLNPLRRSPLVKLTHARSLQ